MINRFVSHSLRITKTALSKKILDGLLTHISPWSVNPFDNFQDNDIFDNFRCSSIN